MKITEVAFIVHPVTDLPRSRQFYEGTLGLRKVQTWGDDSQGWVEYDIAGVTLAITNFIPECRPSADGPSVGLEVDDLPAAIREIETGQGGGKIIRALDETPVCHLAVIADPDGNAIILHKRKALTSPPA